MLPLSGSSQVSSDYILCLQPMQGVSTTSLGEEEESHCPHCRKTLALGSLLEKNTMLAALVETLLETGVQVVDDHC